MYRRLDMGYSTRYKHFSDFMPSLWCEQFLETYVADVSEGLEPAKLVRAYIRLLELWEEHLMALGDRVGGFDGEWFALTRHQVTADLARFLPRG